MSISKFFAGTTLTLLLSSNVFASIQETTLHCGPALKNNHLLVGVGYAVRITKGFDTHAPNGHGGVGVAFGPDFELLSTVVYPNAEPKSLELKVESMDKKGNYHITAEQVQAVVNKKISRAVVTFGSGAIAKCK